MPQSEAKFQINQFTGGLVTDANPLQDAGPISIDELNVEILPHGGRRRRRALDAEVGAVPNPTPVTDTERQTWAFHVSDWDNVADVPNLAYTVYQQGSTLYFYSKENSALSAGLKSFTVDLQLFKTQSATADEVRTTRVSFASGKGALFVSGQTIEPFYVEYNPDTDSLSTTQITIQIRDFEEQAPEVGPQDELGVPTTPEHLYDLLNQGWYQTGPYMRDGGSTNRDQSPVAVLYQGHSVTNGKLPRKNTPWHTGKYLVPEDSARESNTYISPQQVRSSPSGNTLSPFGHYILDAFNKDRTQAIRDENDFLPMWALSTSIDALEVETTDERPVAVAFYAGRAWYCLGNNVYYSQQLDNRSLNKAGRCYQEGDPTNEAESDIVATDGGFINIPEMGKAQTMAATKNAIIVFADNGVWSVTGTSGAYFTAVDFTVTKLANIGMRSPWSVVEAEGLLFFWGDTGIYVIKPGDLDNAPTIEDLVEDRIRNFYNGGGSYTAIPTSSKRNATGVYDRTNKVVFWMYRSSADAAGLSTSRFAYNRFLNFSLKYSAFFPWATDATATHQIFGGTTSGGLVAFTEAQIVEDSSGVDVTTSGGDTVEVNVQTTTEVSDKLKVAALRNNAAIFGEFSGLSFLDWDGDGVSTDYSSYIETFYHIQDDTMAYMQAPYVYAYFKRVEEEPFTTDIVNSVTFSSIQSGGATFSSEVLGYNFSDVLQTYPNHGIILGEDGKRYSVDTVSGGSSTVSLWDVDISGASNTITKTGSSIQTDLISLGIEPTGGYLTTTPTISVAPVPGTAYFIVIGSHASGVSVSKFIAYCRVNNLSTVEVVGGWGGRTDGLNVQFSPGDIGGGGPFLGMGWVDGYKRELDPGHSKAATHNTVEHQYPMVLAYYGEGRSTIMAIPPINAVVLGLVSDENSSTPWFNREIKMGTVFTDADLFDTRDSPEGTSWKNRTFVLPGKGSGKLFVKPNLRDIERHIAATETKTSTWIQTHDATYPNGFISSADVVVASSGVNSLGITSTAANPVAGAHTTAFPGYPFSDETDEFDGTPGTSSDNYSDSPSNYPLLQSNINGPWLVFFPKIYKNDPENIKIYIYAYNPLTETSKLLDTLSGKIIDFATDLPAESGLVPRNPSVFWDRSNGDVIVALNYARVGAEYSVVTKVGTFDPVVLGVSSTVASINAGQSLQILEGSCLLNTRWDWSNNTASGKVSRDYQIYRGGRLQPVTDPANPEPTGLPVLVSKNKTKGRGRVLQLRFRSEQGKDFELYGWGVWSGKNTRF